MSSLISTDSSIPEKIRSAWIAHPKSRITLGLALLAGGLVATASGATAVAGVLLATRASISAIGGYITSTGLIDLIPAKNTGVLQGLTSPAARRIVGITAGGVAGLLALGGLDIPPSTSALEHILPSPVSLTSSSLLWVVTPPPIQDIFTDILRDHPTQWCITLEQSVRRIEWLSQGIRLDESEKLIALNESVYADIRTPGSRVYESLKTLGYLEHHSFEEVCKKLSSDDIEKIITEAYGSVSAPEIVSPETPSPTGFLLEKIPPSLLERNISSHYLLGAGVVAGLAGVGYLGYRALRESRASTSPTLAPRENRSLPSSRTLPQTFPWNSTHPLSIPLAPPVSRSRPLSSPAIVSPISPPPRSPDILPVSLPTTDILPTSTPEVSVPYLLSPDELRTRDMVTALFTQDYEWAPNSDRTKHTPSEYIEFFEGSAYVGGYDGILRFDGEGLQITFISYDESVRGGYTQTEKFSIERILSRDHPKKFLQEMMDRAFLEIMLQRDQNKQKELTNIRGFIIPRGHGRMIYDHLEQPEVLRNENEVLGYWTSSSYHMKDGELLLEFMTNPTLEEQEFSPVHCKPIDDDINTYYRMLGPLSAIPHKVSRKEYEIIQRDFNARDTECKHIGRGMYVWFAGLMSTFNWHKHPNSLIHPSGGDVHEGLNDMNETYPDACVYFYTIVVAVNESEARAKQNDPTCLVLPRDTYGGTRSYIARSYKMFRWSPYTTEPAGAMQQIKIWFFD